MFQWQDSSFPYVLLTLYIHLGQVSAEFLPLFLSALIPLFEKQRERNGGSREEEKSKEYIADGKFYIILYIFCFN